MQYVNNLNKRFSSTTRFIKNSLLRSVLMFECSHAQLSLNTSQNCTKNTNKKNELFNPLSKWRL